MFYWNLFCGRSNLYRKQLFANIPAGKRLLQCKDFRSCYHSHRYNLLRLTEERFQYVNSLKFFSLHRKWYSSSLIDGDVSQLETNKKEKELKKVTELFPSPRETLNIVASRTPDKIFDVYFKLNVVSPKGVRKKSKSTASNEWMCTYAFVWPEKMKFESTALSKRQAAEKAATQALHYLYSNGHINAAGHPLYDKNVLNELKTSLNVPLEITVSDNSVERIQKIWEDYEAGIKEIYERTFKEAKQKIVSSHAAVTKDSTIDDEDDFSEDESSLQDDDDDVSELKVHIHPVYGRSITPASETTLRRRDRVLQQRFQRYDEELTPLPIDQYADEITSVLSTNRVAVLVGAAGCGKSTRAPAAILRHLGARTAALVSEPRRVAAIGLAERVASELGEEVGESVGYQVRLHAKLPKPPAGSILYCTSGVLLRRLQTNPGLSGCTHVFLDEAHERDVNTDLSMLLLKRATVLNPQLRVVVMSATLDCAVFSRYFDPCPVIEVPGRTFPVEVSYLEDIEKDFGVRLPVTKENCKKEDGKPYVNCQEVAEVIKAVDRSQPEGAILVFLPGWAEIKQTKLLLDARFPESSTHLVLPVHSRLSAADQSKMFCKALPGVRKIVLATNIAETSITIPDVVYVIDTGSHKENRIKEGTGTASLETVWVSRASGKQRAGRAGRVQPGHCYRMYTSDKEADFVAYTTPEILRIPLEQTVLDCKTYAPDDKVASFLSQLPEPPTEKAIDFAIKDLIDVGALTPTEQLTRIGSLLSNMTVHPRLGLCLLHAAVCGALVAAADVVTHCADNQQLFQDAHDRRQEIRDILRKLSPVSDHAALHWIQAQFEHVVKERGWQGVDEWCGEYGLRKDRLKYVRALSIVHLEQVLKSGIIEPTTDPEELSRFSNCDELTAALLLSGSNAILKTKRHVKTKGKLSTVTELFTSTGDRAHIGNESVNYNITKRTPNALLTYFGGFHSTERRALVVYKSSLITPHVALLFAKGDVYKNQIIDDVAVLSLPRHRLEVRVPASQADTILRAKEMLWNTFQYYIERDLSTLDYNDNINVSRFKVRLIKAIEKILVTANKERVEGKKIIDDIT